MRKPSNRSRTRNECRACGAKGNGYGYIVPETITNRDGKRVNIVKKYWNCLACDASTFINAFEQC